MAIAHSNLAYALALIGDFEGADVRLATAIDLGYQNWVTLTEMIEELRAEANQPTLPPR